MLCLCAIWNKCCKIKYELNSIFKNKKVFVAFKMAKFIRAKKREPKK